MRGCAVCVCGVRSPEFKDFLNSIWHLQPSARPTFQELNDAADGDPATLEQQPALRWLAGPRPKPREMVAALQRRVGGFFVDLQGVQHAFKRFLSAHPNVTEAFNVLDRDHDGSVSAAELCKELSNWDADCTEIQVRAGFCLHRDAPPPLSLCLPACCISPFISVCIPAPHPLLLTAYRCFLAEGPRLPSCSRGGTGTETAN